MKMFLETSTIYLHKAPVDFRKGINSLSFIVEQHMNLNPFTEALFVFCNRTRDQLKVLYWQRNGFCLWQKRLEKDKFA
ncbi:IS66 family insertion sequence element accessory protein TnpB [Vibrio splendidus]|uniref:IS66 family insertion sequence element accessory protein TnpB n=1 Tax=Vibrio splendidus TaxID=29497 RepID=A0ABD5AGB8_VIBSP|nr:IS66 family insertion sequence element accessory protein TnpB [Vibrio splendidus]MDP2492272.1 IS66 family insertion sequence element accessory protein TnpB [Vibrio splendidus]